MVTTEVCLLFADCLFPLPSTKMIFLPILLLVLMYSTCDHCILPSKYMAHFPSEIYFKILQLNVTWIPEDFDGNLEMAWL